MKLPLYVLAGPAFKGVITSNRLGPLLEIADILGEQDVAALVTGPNGGSSFGYVYANAPERAREIWEES